MPLPEGGNIPWPPAECDPVYKQYATWGAWYASDIEQLAAVYSGSTGATDTTGFFASERGGFRGTVGRAWASLRRWFWGTRTSGNQQRGKLHVPIAADIAAASADLLFSEPPTVTVPEAPGAKPKDAKAAPDKTQQRLDELMDDGMHATLLEAAEIAAALGGVFLRIVWDESKRDCPWITAVHPDAAVPEWQWGDLSAVTFWKVIKTTGKIVVRHLERHEKGKILHAVYQGDGETLGIPVPLTDYPETRGIAEYLDDSQEIDTGAPDRLTAVYVPNMKPNRIWRNTPGAAHLGRSDYAGVEPLMDALDMTYSSWMRDVELGKARLIVPREYLTANGAGQGASLDLDQEIYEGINAMGGEDGKPEITQVQFAIRVAEHQATCTDLKTQIVTTAGYSAQTFGLTGEVAMTATEVAAKERRSHITRDRKTRYWRPALGNLYETWLAVDAAKFSSGVTPVRPQITWADAVSVDPLAQAQELNQLTQAEAMSTEQKVRKLHPDWDDDTVDAEVKAIQDEKNGPALEEPGAELGPPGTAATDQAAEEKEPVPIGG